MKFQLQPLPYPYDALEPILSATALEVHYEKHHKGYMDKLKKLIEGKPEEKLSLESLIQTTRGDVFNNAAQIWNHSFFWQCMRPKGGGRPEARLLAVLEPHFGSYERFRREFAEAANGEFGSGWAWLVQEPGGHLKICSSTDAENPLQRGATPLLTLDVWEHAYYLDYRNERSRYVDGFLDRLLNWQFVESNLAKGAEARGDADDGRSRPHAPPALDRESPL